VNESGWTVEENGKWVAVTPRHICILFRRLRNFSTDVTRAYVRALEARRVSHVLVGGRSFHRCLQLFVEQWRKIGVARGDESIEMLSKSYPLCSLPLPALDRPLDGNHGEIHPKGEDFVAEGVPFIMATCSLSEIAREITGPR
jgi:hypothetical protein